jgi:hypothetical protein
MTKATKINESSWLYRGFTIHRNYTSPRGTGQVCSTQQGYRLTPGGGYGSSTGIVGDWFPTLGDAVSRVEMLYAKGEAGTLRPEMAAVLAEAKRLACESGEPAACPDQHLCRHGIDN